MGSEISAEMVIVIVLASSFGTTVIIAIVYIIIHFIREQRYLQGDDRISTTVPDVKKIWKSNTFNNMTDESCVICLNRLAKHTILTSCSHKFHLTCIQQWEAESIQNSQSLRCPVCRHDLYDDFRIHIQTT